VCAGEATGLRATDGANGVGWQLKFVKVQDVRKATTGFGKYKLLDIRPVVDFEAVSFRRSVFIQMGTTHFG
jgi:hypothetical protein